MTGNNVLWFTAEQDNLIKLTKNYKHILLYPVVDTDIIMTRLLERAKKEGRLPDPKIVETAITNAQNNLAHIAPYFQEIILFNESLEEILKISKTCNVSHHFLQNKTELFTNFIKGMCGGQGVLLKAYIVYVLITLVVFVILFIIAMYKSYSSN